MVKSYIDGTRKIYIIDDSDLQSLFDDILSNKSIEKQSVKLIPTGTAVTAKTLEQKNIKPNIFTKGEYVNLTPVQVAEKFGIKGVMNMYHDIPNISGDIKSEVITTCKKKIKENLQNQPPSDNRDDFIKFINVYNFAVKKGLDKLAKSMSYNSTDLFIDNSTNAVIKDAYEKLYNDLLSRVSK